MQIYKEIKILNTRPEKSPTNKVKHHLYGFHSVKKIFSRALVKFIKQKIEDILNKTQLLLVVQDYILSH